MTFVECLFNKDEHTCSSRTPYGTAIQPVHTIYTDDAFFSINPMDPTKTRADASVTKFRNFLVEMDKMALEKQDQYITEIGMPYSTAVYSGSKSIHYIISLEEELPDVAAYRSMARRIYKAVGQNYVDVNCKNPSRFSRLPGHIREDKGKEQKLLKVNYRIPNLTLEKWLLERGVEPEEIWDNLTLEARSQFKNPGRLYSGTKNFLMYGAPQGEWNPRLFKAAADLYRCGYNEQEVEAELLKVTGTLDFNDRKTIASAIKNEMSKK